MPEPIMYFSPFIKEIWVCTHSILPVTLGGTLGRERSRSRLPFFPAEKKSVDEETEGKKRRVSRAVCPFYSYEHMQFLRDEVLVGVKDIEQLVHLGREAKACPYYGSRYAIPAAQVSTRCAQPGNVAAQSHACLLRRKAHGAPRDLLPGECAP